MYIFGILLALILLVLGICYWCYRLGFYASRKDVHPEGFIDLYLIFLLPAEVIETKGFVQQRIQLADGHGLDLLSGSQQLYLGADLDLALL